MKRFHILVVLILAVVDRAPAITLESVLQRTLENNPEIQKAKYNLEAASGRRLVFRSIAFPDVTIGAALGDQGGHRAGQGPNRLFGFGRGGATQAVFNAALPASLRRGNVEVLIAQQQLNLAVVEQLHAARVAFYTALYNHSLQQVREKQLQHLEDNINTQKGRYEAGLVERSIFVGAQVQAREIDPRIDTARRAHDGALLKMAEVMGSDLTAELDPLEPEGELVYKPLVLDVDEEAALARQDRVDLKLARLMVRAASEDERIMEAGYYPTINAVVSGDYIPVSGVRRQSEGSPRRSDDVISSEIRAGGAYTWRVVDNGKVYGGVERKKAIREINELQVKKLEADVPRELSRIRVDLDAIATKQKSLNLASAAAEQNAATLQENLAAGIISQLEYRIGETDLLEVRSGLLGLAYQQSVSRAEWDRATGRYFQFSDDRNVR